MSVPIAAPKISDAAKREVCALLDSGGIADGERVRAFEREFAEYVGVDYAVATSSGTTALQTMLEAAGISDTDVVLTTPFSFIASANAIEHAGAEVTFADIDPATYNLDPSAVRADLERRDDVTALLPVHLYGLPAEMSAFCQLAREHDLLLFEDAAQAHGATCDGYRVGSFGDAGAFSFYPTKNMTTGEGGMITTDDRDLAERARKLVDHGRSGDYHHETVGYNFRMTNIEAAIGRDQLSRLPQWVESRQQNARQLTDRLSAVDGVTTPSTPDGRTHAFHQYTVRTPFRERIIGSLEEHGVGYGVYYPTPISEQPPYSSCGPHPEAEFASETVLSLPVHPSVTAADIKTIRSAVVEGME